MPYLIELLDMMSDIERRVKNAKRKIVKDFAGYGIAVIFTEYDGTPCDL